MKHKSVKKPFAASIEDLRFLGYNMQSRK